MAPLIALEGRQEPAGGRVTPAGFTIAPDNVWVFAFRDAKRELVMESIRGFDGAPDPPVVAPRR
jgi:hypothetical protein